MALVAAGRADRPVLSGLRRAHDALRLVLSAFHGEGKADRRGGVAAYRGSQPRRRLRLAYNRDGQARPMKNLPQYSTPATNRASASSASGPAPHVSRFEVSTAS